MSLDSEGARRFPRWRRRLKIVACWCDFVLVLPLIQTLFDRNNMQKVLICGTRGPLFRLRQLRTASLESRSSWKTARRLARQKRIRISDSRSKQAKSTHATNISKMRISKYVSKLLHFLPDCSFLTCTRIQSHSHNFRYVEVLNSSLTKV